MKVLVDVMVVPIGVGLSLSGYVAACEQVFKDAKLTTRLHANGTNVEGEWDDVFAAVKRCHEVLHEMGAHHVRHGLGPRPVPLGAGHGVELIHQVAGHGDAEAAKRFRFHRVTSRRKSSTKEGARSTQARPPVRLTLPSLSSTIVLSATLGRPRVRAEPGG